MHERIENAWGLRTPYSRGDPWPVRIDEAGETAGTDVWAQTASVLHSNGDGYDVAVPDGRITGVRLDRRVADAAAGVGVLLSIATFVLIVLGS